AVQDAMCIRYTNRFARYNKKEPLHRQRLLFFACPVLRGDCINDINNFSRFRIHHDFILF
ncbi:hypothetical protein, partial [Bacillus subtilis]|uniref:hypothetical protein n=1 Tax=Bacillus subtilis TaxID=1423 RepID=UPI001BDB9DD6